MERNWEEYRQGNSNQNILYEKIDLQLIIKEKAEETIHIWEMLPSWAQRGIWNIHVKRWCFYFCFGLVFFFVFWDMFTQKYKKSHAEIHCCSYSFVPKNILYHDGKILGKSYIFLKLFTFYYLHTLMCLIDFNWLLSYLRLAVKTLKI